MELSRIRALSCALQELQATVGFPEYFETADRFAADSAPSTQEAPSARDSSGESRQAGQGGPASGGPSSDRIGGTGEYEAAAGAAVAAAEAAAAAVAAEAAAGMAVAAAAAEAAAGMAAGAAAAEVAGAEASARPVVEPDFVVVEGQAQGGGGDVRQVGPGEALAVEVEVDGDWKDVDRYTLRALFRLHACEPECESSIIYQT